MGYNITSTKLIHTKNFAIGVLEFEQIRDAHKRGAPDSSVLRPGCLQKREDERLHVISFPWHGDWSGHSFADGTLEAVLAAFDGEADLVLTWEGGDDYTGLRLRDHKVTRHTVLMQLGEETK